MASEEAKSPTPEDDTSYETTKDEPSEISTDVDNLKETEPEISSKNKTVLAEISPDKEKAKKKIPSTKTSKTQKTPELDKESEDLSSSKTPPSSKASSVSEAPITLKATETDLPSSFKETENDAPIDNIIPTKTVQKDKPLTMKEKRKQMEEMEAKIAAEKTKQKEKEKEPVFAGMKLKKSNRVQRQWTEPEQETVQLKDHAFEKLPEVEMVNIKYYIYFLHAWFQNCFIQIYLEN